MCEILHVRWRWTHVGVLIAYVLSAFAPAEGFITSVAIARDGRAIAGGTYADPASVYWWRWNGRHGSWNLPTIHISALGWEGAETLLVGDRGEMRKPAARWWRVGLRGRVISECNGSPPHAWTLSISGDIWKLRRAETAWLHVATAHDCSALVAATERRLIWVKSR
jgi:hypothetical protein